MFTYYIHSLHRHHEQNVVLAKKATDAYLEFVAHLTEGYYNVAMLVLHPVMSPASGSDALLGWNSVQIPRNQYDTVTTWFKACQEKIDQLHHGIISMVEHQATGWNNLANEFMSKAKCDSSPAVRDLIKYAENALNQIATAESTTIEAVEAMTKAPRTKATAQRSNRRSSLEKGPVQ